MDLYVGYCAIVNKVSVIISEDVKQVQQVHQTNISYSGSTLPVIVFYGRLNDVNYSEVSVECGSVTQTQQLSTENDSKYDDRTSSIRLSIIILGVFCIVMILLHVSLSVIMRNDMKIEPVSIQIEEINYDSI